MKKVIFDMDSAGDDILALLYLALQPSVEVVGITAVNGASGDIEQASWVALNTIALTGKDIPVYRGADKPLRQRDSAEEEGDPVNFDEELRGKLGDRLDRFNERAEKPMKEVEDIHAVDFLIQAFERAPGEITLITTGPLTNIALALRKRLELAKEVREAYVLGGTFHAPGNITPVTEYNIWADPEAAREVFRSDMKITLVPLDICEDNRFAGGMLTRDHLADMKAYGSGAVVDYITGKFPVYIDIWREYFKLSGFPMDDVITVAAALDESFCEYTEEVFVDVELEGSLSRGQTIAFFGCQINKYPERMHKNTRIAKYLYGGRFMESFVNTIIGR